MCEEDGMEEWKEYKLGDVCSRLSSGKNISASKISDSDVYPVFGGNGLRGYTDNSNFTGECAIIGRQGAFCGNVRFFSGEAYMTEHAVVVCGNEKANTRYLSYLLSTMNLGRLSGQSAQPGLAVGTLAKQLIKLPPLPTQQKIAAILSSLDDKIELNNKINTNLEQQAQALFKNWFVNKYEKEGTIGDYCSVKSGFAFKSSWWQDEGTKVIRIGDIEQGCLNLETCAHVATDKIEVAKDFIVQGGDLVIAMTGATIGKFSMIPKTQEPILVNQRVGKFFLGNNPIEKVPFIYCTLKQEEVITEFINRGQGSAQPNISTGDILSIPCWIPSKNEIDNFNKTIQPLFETVISNQEENRKLSSLRDSLLPKLMNGEIEVGIK